MRSEIEVASPSTGLSSAVGGRLSNTKSRVGNVVPYLWYSPPGTPTFARSVKPFAAISRNHFLYVGAFGDMPAPRVGSPREVPPPTMDTSRPPGASIRPASAMCRAPVISSFLSPMRPAVWLNGGFMTTTEGCGTPRFGRMPEICSAFSTCVFSAPNKSRR